MAAASPTAEETGQAPSLPLFCFPIHFFFYGSRPEAPLQKRETGTPHPAADRARRPTPTGVPPPHAGVSAAGVVEHVRFHDRRDRGAGISAHRSDYHQAGARS